MKQDQEPKPHICRFCKQGFLTGRQLGGHMRRHLALISASKQQKHQENVNAEMGSVVLDDQGDDDGDDVMVKKSQRVVGVDQDFGEGELGNGDQIIKKIQENDDGGDVMVNKSQRVVGAGQDFGKGKLGNADQTIMKIQENDDGGDVMVNKSQRVVGVDQDFGKGKLGNGDKMIKRIQENDYGDDVMVKKSQGDVGVDQGFDKGKMGNVYVLRENPKKSWRVSNDREALSKDYVCKKRCDTRKECVCEKCGKSFGSLKALYGHMRCHSVKKSRPLDQDDDEEDEVANPVRKKRSCTRYKSPKPSHHCGSLSSCYDEVEYGAICLMMLSRGVRDLDEAKMVISDQASNVEFEVSVDGLMNNKSKVGLKKDLVFESGSGQVDPGWVGSTKPRASGQDFGDMGVADFDISFELLERGIIVQFV